MSLWWQNSFKKVLYKSLSVKTLSDNIVKVPPAIHLAVKCAELPACPLEFQQQLEQSTLQLEQSRPSTEFEEAEAAVG